MQVTDYIKYLHVDCMEYLASCPDNYFDLAIPDPPYGMNIGKMGFVKKGRVLASNNSAALSTDYTKMDTSYDKAPPPPEYFAELMRVSKNCIVWGGNFFADMLPPSRGWIFWDKDNGTTDFADGELAWTSFDMPLRKVTYRWNGMLQGKHGNKKLNEKRIHPNQKPTFLYRWILKNYAQKGDKILDTHTGSASSLIAAHEEKYCVTGLEINKDYYNRSMKRIKNRCFQTALF